MKGGSDRRRPNDDLILTDGVTASETTYECPDLGLWISRDEPDLRRLVLEYGFASDGRRSPTLVRSRAVRLREGAFRAAGQSLLHNTCGMAGTLIAVVIAGAASVLLNAPSFTALCVAVVLFALGVLVHEAGHAVAFRLVAPRDTAILVSKGWGCHLVRRPLARRAEITVTAAGPLAPLVCATLLAPVAFLSPFVFFAWLAIAAGHAVFLAVPTGDGANLRRALRAS